MQPTMRIACRCTALLLLRVLPLAQSDGRTDGQKDTASLQYACRGQRNKAMVQVH